MNCYFFIADDNCSDYAKIAINSLLQTNPTAEVILYTTDKSLSIPNIKIEILKDIEHLDFSIPNITVNALDLLGHRLKVLDMLKERYDKIIMLDTDIIVLENIDELFKFSENFIFGNDTLESHSKFRKTINNNLWYKPKYYLNSGVMLLPSKVLKSVNLFEKFKKELALRHEKYVCPEQDLLNFVFKDVTFNLGDTINQFVTNMRVKKPKVIHYAGAAKPTRINPYLMMCAKWFYEIFEEHLELNKQAISHDFYIRNKNALNARILT